ncbi:helix-hairpin-helix domain-containing protein [Yinghuangia sp. YIM S09857]|uniref:ComEA family DNA-binding protein n=1 Tax=Yinghuangia sp. YIM S09857 TaxID=3436929 RepID=UPI003F53C49A
MSKSPNARTASRLAALFPADPAPGRHAAADSAFAPPGSADAAYGPPGSEDAVVRHASASAGIPPPGVPPPDPWAGVPRDGGAAEWAEPASTTERHVFEPSQTEPSGSGRARSEPVRSEPVRPEPVQPEPVQPEPVEPEPVQSEPAAPRPLPAATRFAAGVADRIPPGLKAFRIAVDVRVVAAVAALALLAIVVAGVGWWRSRPQSVAVPTVAASGTARPSDQLALSTSSTSAALPDPTGPATTAPTTVAVAVHVVGRVANPGLFALPSGSRVDDALKAAGGALPGTDLAALNLARVLSDGEQVPVGVSGATAVPAPTGGAPVSSAAGKGTAKGAGTGVVDLNTATAEQLEGLPGIGPVMAAGILDWRRLHGRFTSVEQLREVRGIGERRFEELRSRVRV